MAWIAADDARCHDEAVRPVLATVARALDLDDGLRPTSPVALVRAVAARLRAEPALRDLRVRDLADPQVATGPRPQRPPRRDGEAGGPASPAVPDRVSASRASQ